MKKELKAMRESSRTGVLSFGTGVDVTGATNPEQQYTNDDNPFGDSNLTKTFR